MCSGASSKPPVIPPDTYFPRSPSNVSEGTAGIGQELGSFPAQERRDAPDANARRGGVLRRKREARKNKAEHLGGAQPNRAGQVPIDCEGAVLCRRLHGGRRRHRARYTSVRLWDNSLQHNSMRVDQGRKS